MKILMLKYYSNPGCENTTLGHWGVSMGDYSIGSRELLHVFYYLFPPHIKYIVAWNAYLLTICFHGLGFKESFIVLSSWFLVWFGYLTQNFGWIILSARGLDLQRDPLELLCLALGDDLIFLYVRKVKLHVKVMPIVIRIWKNNKFDNPFRM